MDNPPVDRRPRFELRQVMSDGNETLEICSLCSIAEQARQIRMDRKGFLGLSAFAAAATLVTACAGPSETLRKIADDLDTPADTTTSPVVQTVAPRSTPASGRTATPSPTPKPVTCTGLNAHSKGINVLAFSPDGTLLVSGGADAIVKVWQAQDGSLVHTLADQKLTSPVLRLAFKLDGSVLAAAGPDDKAVQVWKLKDGSPDTGYTPDDKTANNRPTSVAFSADSSYIAFGLANGVIELRPLKGQAAKRKWQAHTARVTDLAFAPDGATLASTASDGVKLWVVRDTSAKPTPTETGQRSTSIAFTPRGEILGSVPLGRSVWLWNPKDKTTRLIGLPDPTPSPTRGSATSTTAATTATKAATATGTTAKAPTATKTVAKVATATPAPAGGTNPVAVSQDGKLIATSSSTTVRVWSADDGTLLHEFKAHSDSVSALVFSPDGNTMATAADDKTMPRVEHARDPARSGRLLL